MPQQLDPKSNREPGAASGFLPSVDDLDVASFDWSRTDLDPGLVEEMAGLIADGGTRKMACQYAGVTTRTFRSWMQQGREEAGLPLDERTKYWFFYRTMNRALLANKHEIVGKMKEAGEDDWRMWSWLASRMHPDEFSQKAEIEHTVPPNKRGRSSEEIDEEDKSFLTQMFSSDGETYRAPPNPELESGNSDSDSELDSETETEESR